MEYQTLQDILINWYYYNLHNLRHLDLEMHSINHNLNDNSLLVQINDMGSLLHTLVHHDMGIQLILLYFLYQLDNHYIH